jgi:hypothetical protein
MDPERGAGKKFQDFLFWRFFSGTFDLMGEYSSGKIVRFG